jgi:hypothetical protein
VESGFVSLTVRDTKNDGGVFKVVNQKVHFVYQTYSIS